MKPKEEIFRFIKDNIEASIDEEWEAAILIVNVSNKFSSYKGSYFHNGLKKNLKVSRFDPQIDLDVIDLHTITTGIDCEIKKWNVAYFNLNKNGELKIEYMWDQELFDSVYGLT